MKFREDSFISIKIKQGELEAIFLWNHVTGKL